MKKVPIKKIIITAGGTREPIDPVRYIGNRSSGKMGIAILKACLKKGIRTVLIHAPLSINLPKGDFKIIPVETTMEMQKAVYQEFTDGTILFMAAAPADFRPAVKSHQKIKKENISKNGLTLKLIPNPDILSGLAQKRRKGFIVGFAAETANLLDNAKEKMIKKNIDLMVANDVSKKHSGFSVDTNKVILIHKDGKIQKQPLMKKSILGGILLETALSSSSY